MAPDEQKMSDFDMARTLAMSGVNGVQETFTKPDDDWDTMFILMAEDRPVVAAFAVDTKDQIAVAITKLIREHKGTAVALVTSAWTSQKANDEAMESGDGPRTMPADQPDRREVVHLLVAAKDGKVEMQEAEIIRHEGAPPTLDEWRKFGTEDSGKLAGRFPDAIKAGFGGETTMAEGCVGVEFQELH
jgi:hypothetical protein